MAEHLIPITQVPLRSSTSANSIGSLVVVDHKPLTKEHKDMRVSNDGDYVIVDYKKSPQECKLCYIYT